LASFGSWDSLTDYIGKSHHKSQIYMWNIDSKDIIKDQDVGNMMRTQDKEQMHIGIKKVIGAQQDNQLLTTPFTKEEF